MAKFTLPPVQKNSREDFDEIHGMEDFRRNVDIPANSDVLDEMEPDKEVTVILKGKVKAKVEASGDTFQSNHFELEITEVAAYQVGDDRLADLLEEDE